MHGRKFPGTSISIDTETTSLSSAQSEDWTNEIIPTGSNNVISPASTINIEKSSDVVIGPLTQFHGPVTIYQNVTTNTQKDHESLEHEKSKEIVNSQKQFHVKKERLKPSIVKLIKPRLYKWVIFCIILAVVAILAIIYVIILYKNNTSTMTGVSSENVETESYIQPVTIPPNFPHQMYTRDEWKGLPSLNFTQPLHHPTEYVIISHTSGIVCLDFFSCSAKVKTIQSYHMQILKSPDIGYNFLIGGDGDIYIGRGWDIRNFHKDKNIGISIIGDYVETDIMTARMVSALKELIELGVKLEKLASDYKVICHNQTSVTFSPGKNVYKEVVKLPHYYPGHVKL